MTVKLFAFNQRWTVDRVTWVPANSVSEARARLVEADHQDFISGDLQQAGAMTFRRLPEMDEDKE